MTTIALPFYLCCTNKTPIADSLISISIDISISVDISIPVDISIVYFYPMDRMLDSVAIAEACEAELWNLHTESANAQSIAELWAFEAESATKQQQRLKQQQKDEKKVCKSGRGWIEN